MNMQAYWLCRNEQHRVSAQRIWLPLSVCLCMCMCRNHHFYFPFGKQTTINPQPNNPILFHSIQLCALWCSSVNHLCGELVSYSNIWMAILLAIFLFTYNCQFNYSFVWLSSWLVYTIFCRTSFAFFPPFNIIISIITLANVIATLAGHFTITVAIVNKCSAKLSDKHTHTDRHTKTVMASKLKPEKLIKNQLLLLLAAEIRATHFRLPI